MLTSFQCSLDHHLRNCGQDRSIREHREFAGSRGSETKAKESRKDGKGAKKNAVEPLSVAGQGEAVESRQLGDPYLQVLQCTVLFYTTMHFGWRGRD